MGLGEQGGGRKAFVGGLDLDLEFVYVCMIDFVGYILYDSVV